MGPFLALVEITGTDTKTDSPPSPLRAVASFSICISSCATRHAGALRHEHGTRGGCPDMDRHGKTRASELCTWLNVARFGFLYC